MADKFPRTINYVGKRRSTFGGHRYRERGDVGSHLGRGVWLTVLDHDEKNCPKCKKEKP